VLLDLMISLTTVADTRTLTLLYHPPQRLWSDFVPTRFRSRSGGPHRTSVRKSCVALLQLANDVDEREKRRLLRAISFAGQRSGTRTMSKEVVRYAGGIETPL
jgi:hypothetical protein